MEASAYIGGVIVCLGYLIAGVRLWRLSLKTQQKPERLLSVALLLWGLAYVGWQIPLILSDESLLTPLYFSARILTDAGTVVSALFLRLVFRPNSGIAGVFVTVIAASVILGVTGSAWVGDWAALYPLKNLWWWLEWAAVIVSMAWIGIEGFHHYGKARLRHQGGRRSATLNTPMDTAPSPARGPFSTLERNSTACLLPAARATLTSRNTAVVGLPAPSGFSEATRARKPAPRVWPPPPKRFRRQATAKGGVCSSGAPRTRAAPTHRRRLVSWLARGGGAPAVKRSLYLDLPVSGHPEPSRRPATHLATSNQPNF
jgi:hypothetical protein